MSTAGYHRGDHCSPTITLPKSTITHHNLSKRQNVLWTDEMKVESSRRAHSTTDGIKMAGENIILAMKHGAGSIMIWSCFAAWTICPHQGENEFPSFSRYSIGWYQGGCAQTEAKEKVGMQQDNDPKTIKKIYLLTYSWLYKRKILLLERLSQSPDFNPTQML